MIYLTDYIDIPDIEREIAGENLITFHDSDVNKVGVTVLLVWHFRVDEDSLRDFPNVRAIVRFGVGFDNIDVEYCVKSGIKVFNNPDYGVDEVSDTAAAMILSLSRCIGGYNSTARRLVVSPTPQNPWQENINESALRLKESSLGIVGVGRIGTSLALKMQRIFGSIHFYDPGVAAGYEKVIDATRHSTLSSLLSSTNVVSVNAPLNQSTRGMINSDFVSSMTRQSILINSARGGILSDYECLFDGLRSGKLSGIGLDVLPDEPPNNIENNELLMSWLDPSSPFYDRIIINPHTAYYSEFSYEEMRSKAAAMAVRALSGEQSQNRIV